MKYIHPAILKCLKFIGKYLIKLCPTVEYAYSCSFWAVNRYIIFFTITLLLFLFAVHCIACNRYTLYAILVFNNNFFAYRSLNAYIRLTFVFVILIFLCLLYITYAFYLIDYSSYPEYLFIALIYILLGCCCILIALWCIYIYYAYIYLIQIQIVCYMDTLSTLALCAMFVGQLMLVILIRCCATKYCNNNNAVRLICILCTLAFFNLSIAYIFGPILLCKNIAFAVATVGREVHICLFCTILYLYHLLIIRQGPVYFGVYEFSTLASLGGCALGARLGFRTMHAFIQMCFSDFNFFFISFVICILILIYLYIFISFFFDFFFNQ